MLQAFWTRGKVDGNDKHSSLQRHDIIYCLKSFIKHASGVDPIKHSQRLIYS
jgi:hypothetical protein